MNFTLLVKTLESVQVAASVLELPAPAISPWVKMFGTFKDDVYFDQVMAIIQADRDALGDDELDPSYYMD
jgi:hypothetical protein